MILAPFDELDVLRDKLNEQRLKWNPETKPDAGMVKDVIDDLTYLLVLAYVFGKDHACEDLDYKLDIDERQFQDEMYKTLYLEIDGEDWVKRTTKHMETFDVEAVMNVAETEMNRDFNQAGINTATLIGKKAGRSVMKTWNTMADDRVRDTHSYLESVTEPLDRAFFTYDGDSAMAPGGFTLPQNNCGCRCWLTYSFG